MKVRDAMTADVITVGPEATVRGAATLMSDHGVSGLPVVDRDGHLLGIVTEGDLILRQAAPRPRRWWRRFFADPEMLAREYQKAAGVTVGEIMTRAVVSVGADVDVADAARIMYDRGLRRLPVVRGGRLAGILGRSDLVKVLAAAPSYVVALPDAELVRMMRAELSAQAWTPAGIHVEAAGGVIRLWGIAGSESERAALETMAGALPGCRAVESHLIVGATLGYTYGAA
ncbi:MAG: CBS domain-containing protein [Candidatus Rokubacteria bacterium]|nr:CBS domain-containing protein [Candidatus Rokubacteria bacterium]